MVERFSHAPGARVKFVASNVCAAITSLPGTEKSIIAHSLGNMVVSSAIQDWGLSVAHYYMCDSAVPAEAYNSALFNADPANPLVHDAWRSYPTQTWTSCWHQLFNPMTDDRGKLTWKGRFSAVADHPGVVNFYSTGDEVLEVRQLGTPVPQDDLDTGRYAWHKQESYKGRWVSNNLIERYASASNDWAGWGLKSTAMLNADNILVFTPVFTAQRATDLSFIELTTNTVFNPNPSTMMTNTIPVPIRNLHLIYAIPACSVAAGGTDLGVAVNHNLNSDTYKMHDWGRIHPEFGKRWMHSDMKDMAYLYVFPLFTGIANSGGAE